MASSIPHGARSTANQVLAGVDLTRKWILVTGCDEEIGFETMNALAANGAHVFGLASSLASAKNVCNQIGPRATPVECDLADLDSVAAAAKMIRSLQVSLDAIVANAEMASPPTLHTKFEAHGKLPELPRPWQENLLHIGQEALTNTLKYAHARNFETRLSYKAKELCLELRDDGDGFKVKEGHDGVGLTGMRERVEQMGGELKITSARGKGTKIAVVLPCNGGSIS